MDTQNPYLGSPAPVPSAGGYYAPPAMNHGQTMPGATPQNIGADYAALMGYDVPLGNPFARIRHAVLVFLWEFAFTLAFVLVVTAAAAGATIDPLASPFTLSVLVGLVSFLAIWGLSYTSGPINGFHANWGVSLMVYLGYVFNRHNKGFRLRTMIQKILIGGIYFFMYLGLQVVAALAASYFLRFIIGGGTGLGFPVPTISNNRAATLTWFGSTIIGVVYMYGHFVYKTPNTAAAYGSIYGAFTAASWAFIGLSYNPVLYWGPAIVRGTVNRSLTYVLASLGGYLTAWFIFEVDRWFFRIRPVYVGWAPFTYKTWYKYSEMRPVTKSAGSQV